MPPLSEPLVIAIDGPAGVGKSTLARHLATTWKLLNLNTGSYYRALTFLALEHELISPDSRPQALLSDEALCQRLLSLLSTQEWSYDEGGLTISGRRFGAELHTKAVDQWVSPLSSIPIVRQRLNQQFRNLAQIQSLVCEGRDTTSVIFPEATIKIFLDASVQARAWRRFSERPEGQSLEQIRQSIQERDQLDRTKAVGALVLAPGAIMIDSSDLTIQAVCEKVDSIVRDHRQ